MKKLKKLKLVLDRRTLAPLLPAALRAVRGGNPGNPDDVKTLIESRNICEP